MEKNRDQELKEEEEKLMQLEEELEDAQTFDNLNQEMLDFFTEEFQEVLKEEEQYKQEEQQFENAINELEGEFQEDNQREEEQKQNLNVVNQELLQDKQDETIQNSEAQENKKKQQDAEQSKQNAFKEIQESKNNIAEIHENEKKVQHAKKEKEEQEKKMKGLFGFLQALVSIFCPISGLIVGLIGELVTNGDYNGALQRIGQEKLSQNQLKSKQEDLFDRFKQLENISDEKFKKAVKSAQNKSSSILKGLNTKKDVENKLGAMKDHMSSKLNKIQELTTKKMSCQQLTQKFKDLHQEILPKISELKTAKSQNDFSSIVQKITLQQNTVKQLKSNIEKNKSQRQNKVQQ